MPQDKPVVLLGDGEFDGSEVVDWLIKKTTWQFVCRTDRSTKVWYEQQWQALEALPIEEGAEDFLTGVRFTQSQNVGPVNILVIWHQGKEEHWFFVTNCPTAADAKEKYDFRFTIETLFGDWKSRGFNLDDTCLADPERLHRLLLAGAIAYFMMITLGALSIISGFFRQLVRCDAFHHSLFQLGLFYLEHLLNEFLEFPPLIDLPPPLTFDHILFT